MEEKKNLFHHLSDKEIAEEKEKERVTRDGDDIMYLLLIEGVSKTDDSVWKDWLFITGRQNAYEYIRASLRANDEDDLIVDACKSLIYADNPRIEVSKLKLSTSVSLYKFMKNCQVTQSVDRSDDRGFDIEDYYVTDVIPDND